MAAEATVTIPSETFPLGTVFEAFPGVEVEIERVVPHADVIIPYFWVRGVATDDIEAAFSEHPGVKDIRLIDSVEDTYLLRVEWEPEYVGILTTLTETGVVLIEAVGTDEQWTFDIRGDRRDDIAAFLRLCREREIPVSWRYSTRSRPSRRQRRRSSQTRSRRHWNWPTNGGTSRRHDR